MWLKRFGLIAANNSNHNFIIWNNKLSWFDSLVICRCKPRRAVHILKWEKQKLILAIKNMLKNVFIIEITCYVKLAFDLLKNV